MRRSRIAIAGLLLSTLACARRVERFETVETPAPFHSMAPRLHAGATSLYLSWIARSGEPAFQYAARTAGAWSGPRTIATGDSLLANWADTPSVVELEKGALAAQWRVHVAGAEHACAVRVAQSPEWDAGTPHRDGTPTEHAFASLAPHSERRCEVVWLDGREYLGKEEGAAGAQTQLRAADGTLPEGERVLDPRVCDCCPTAMVRTSRGLLVAYRDRDSTEVRDIGLVSRDDSGWGAPRTLARDGWRIAGCPVNGPALAARGDSVVAAWFAMHGATPVVQTARSRDGGTTWSNPTAIDAGNPIGRVGAALLPSGDAAVTWIEATAKDAAEIRARRVLPDGAPGATFTVTRTTPARASGIPQVACFADTLWVAWTEDASVSQVRLASLPVEAFTR